MVRFVNRDVVPRKTKATYLGAILTDTNDNHAEVNNRIADCIATANRLKVFWNKAANTVKWKLQVYDAIIRSKLLYGLETIQLTRGEQNRLDAFQQKGIRRILKIPPTFEDRSWTNDKVIEAASLALGRPLRIFSEVWRSAKFRLLGHLLRAETEDPMRQVVFKKDSWLPRAPIKLRVGKPRDQWVVEMLGEALDEVMQNKWLSYELENEEHQQILREAAAKGDEQHYIFRSKPRKEPKTLFMKGRRATEGADAQQPQSWGEGWERLLSKLVGAPVLSNFEHTSRHLLDTTSHYKSTIAGEDSSSTEDDMPKIF